MEPADLERELSELQQSTRVRRSVDGFARAALEGFGWAVLAGVCGKLVWDSAQPPYFFYPLALLDLTGCRYPRADVRRVILLDGDVILGPGMATHVRVEGAEENVILHVRDGRLFCEAKQPVEVNGAPMDRISGIPMDAHVKVGGLSFVVSNM